MLDRDAFLNESLFTTEEAAQFLRTTPEFLRRARRSDSKIEGPPWCEMAPKTLRYRKSDLLAWSESRLRTSAGRVQALHGSEAA